MGIEVIAEDTTSHVKLVIYKGLCYIFEFKVGELTEDGKGIEHEKYVGYKSSHIDSGQVQEIYLIGVEFSKENRNITNFEFF